MPLTGSRWRQLATVARERRLSADTVNVRRDVGTFVTDRSIFVLRDPSRNGTPGERPAVHVTKFRAPSFDRSTALAAASEEGRSAPMSLLRAPRRTLRQICVQRSEWNSHVTVPKGGRLRYVPMTVRLAAALREQRHLRSARVLCHSDGSSLSADELKHLVERASRRAHLNVCGFTCCGTHSVRTWGCVAHPRGPYRSSRDTRISRRRHGIRT